MNKIIITTSIAFLIVILLIIFVPLYKNNHKETVEVKNIEPFIKSNKDKNELLELFKFVDFHLKKHNIKYWLISGTLLGHVRDNGIISWDNDVDIAIMENDSKKVREIFKNLPFKNKKNKNGCDGCGGNFGDRGIIPINKDLLYGLTGITQVSYLNHNGGVDIIPFKKYKLPLSKYTNKYVQTSLGFRLLFPNEYFEEKDLFPLKKSKFEGVEVYVPNNPIPFLNNNYPNWDKFAIIDLVHTNLKMNDNVKYKYYFNKQ